MRRDVRTAILQLFAHDESLRFSQIESRLAFRSNLLAYHIDQLHKQGLIAKTGAVYCLTAAGERLLPTLSRRASSPLPVILIAPIKSGRVLLLKRTQRPYKNLYGLIGGKLQTGESLQDACRRKLAEAGLRGSMKSLKAIVDEKIFDDECKHHFLLFFVTATCDAQQNWYAKNELRKLPMIPSDKWLLEHKLSARAGMPQLIIDEESLSISKKQ